VRVRLELRRFRCRVPWCPRRIFAERVLSLAAPRVRQTARLRAWLTQVGLAVGGEAVVQLMSAHGIQASARTVLRQVRASELPQVGPVQILTVDGWSQQRGRTFRTILVNLETHHRGSFARAVGGGVRHVAASAPGDPVPLGLGVVARLVERRQGCVASPHTMVPVPMRLRSCWQGSSAWNTGGITCGARPQTRTRNWPSAGNRQDRESRQRSASQVQGFGRAVQRAALPVIEPQQGLGQLVGIVAYGIAVVGHIALDELHLAVQ
jgi:hypothetical protein